MLIDKKEWVTAGRIFVCDPEKETPDPSFVMTHGNFYPVN